MRTANDTLIDNPVDWSFQWVSVPISLRYALHFSIQLKFVGTPQGMLKLQCSNDYDDRAQNIATWTDVECSEQMITSSGDHTWNVQNAGYAWVRAVYVPTGGSATLSTARFTSKGS